MNPPPVPEGLSQTLFKPRPASDFYVFGNLIGSGSVGKVYLCQHKSTRAYFAAKFAPHNEDLQREVEILSLLKHPNIIRFHEAFTVKGSAALIFDYLEGGELFEHILKRHHYSELDGNRIMRQVFSAVEYMHSNHIAHRDLKPENLLCKTRSGDWIVVSDFGFSAKITDAQAMNRRPGTLGYAAPELISTEPPFHLIAHSADMWALGVIMFILLSGQPPFYAANDKELLDKSCRGIYSFDSPQWLNVSETAKDLVRKLLTVDHKKRFTCREALLHDWIAIERYSSQQHLTQTIEELKKFSVTRRRLRGAFLAVRATTAWPTFRMQSNSNLLAQEPTFHLNESSEKLPALEISATNITPVELGQLISLMTEKERKDGMLKGKTVDGRVQKVVEELRPTFEIVICIEGEDDVPRKRRRMDSLEFIQFDQKEKEASGS